MKRRTFINTSGLAVAGLTLASYSPRRMNSANDVVNVGVVGLNSRGAVLTKILLELDGYEIAALCDVDVRTIDLQLAKVKEKQQRVPKTFKDFREMISDPSIDAVVIATADHTHAPFAVYALNAGKHVYLEKPTCYCPSEGEILIRTATKAKGKLQIGNQQRSSQITQEAIAKIHDGQIGAPYEVRTWYTNQRISIGNGTEVPVPDWLDWGLWQGPAPRRTYKSNVVHYNWHWFRHWGTGEICNNAVHEIDIALWALKEKYPTHVESHGGRFHYTTDDWEFFDTQLTTFHYPDNKRIIWDGRSCTNLQIFNRGRGTIIYGGEGSMLIDRNGYLQYDLAGKVLHEQKEPIQVDGTNTSGEDNLTVRHLINWHKGITQNEKLNAPVEEANVSNLLCHLGNMAQDAQKPLKIESKTGRPDDKVAMLKWAREYEKGWEF